MENFLNQATFAVEMGVSRKTVTEWKKQGWLIFSNGLVDVVESKKILKRYRSAGITQSKKSTSQISKVTEQSNLPEQRHIEVGEDETISEAADRIITTLGANMDMDEAKRVKENYLALLNQLEYQQKSGELVEIQLAQKVLFDEFRAQRDAWLNFPSRVGAMLASDFDLPADKVTEVLTKYVHEQVTSLGEPQSEFN